MYVLMLYIEIGHRERGRSVEYVCTYMIDKFIGATYLQQKLIECFDPWFSSAIMRRPKGRNVKSSSIFVADT